MITEKVRFQFWSNKEREQLKEEFFVDSNKLAEASSELAKKETNDCVVRAFMCALNVSYDQAHNYIKTKMNRKDGNGTYVNAYAKNIIGTTKNGLKISFIGTHPSRAFMKTAFGSDKVLVNKKYKKATGFTLNIKCTYGLTIGADKTGNAGYYYYGFMDDLRVSRYARYTANFTPPTAALPDKGPI